MRFKTVCEHCNSGNIDYLGNEKWYCNKCQREVTTKDIVCYSPYERTRNAVYATGNRWAIENFNATH